MKPFETADSVLLRGQAETDRPTFEEPWQARVFALATHLNERGLFEWPQFATVLGAHVASSDAPTGADYYHCWLAALVDVLETVGVRGDLGIEP